MASKFVDYLESRTFLSVGGDDFELAVDPGITDEGVMMTLSAPSKAASTVKKGYYSGKPTLGGKSGNVIFQVTSVSSGAITGVLKSADWGAFNVTVTGTVNNGTVTFSGKNSYTQIKSFKGTISGSTLSGTLSVVQNGIGASGNFSGKYSTKAPAMADVMEPNVKGTYTIKADGKNISMSITQQIDGKFWGKIDGDAMTGVILADGGLKMLIKESDGKTLVEGNRASTGKMTGRWHWYDNDGDDETGTFTATKKK